MGIRLKLFLGSLLIFLIPSTVFAQENLKTGYDVYHNILLMEQTQTPDDAMTVMLTMGYLSGYVDGLAIMQDALFNTMFPKELMSEGERGKLAKEINFHRLNIPKNGVHVEQLILIYKKWAEKHPKNLNETARACIFLSLVEPYGWK